MLKENNFSVLGIVTLVLFISLVIYLITQDISLVGPL